MTIEQIIEAARRLSPDEVRARLDELDHESRVLRAILRAMLRGQITKSGGRPVSMPDRHRRLTQSQNGGGK